MSVHSKFYRIILGFFLVKYYDTTCSVISMIVIPEFTMWIFTINVFIINQVLVIASMDCRIYPWWYNIIISGEDPDHSFIFFINTVYSLTLWVTTKLCLSTAKVFWWTLFHYTNECANKTKMYFSLIKFCFGITCFFCCLL